MEAHKQTLICLVGEQPLPNLLPVLSDKPARVLLAYTESTYPVYKRLKRVIERKLGPQVEVYPLEISPYHIGSIYKLLDNFIQRRAWPTDALTFNLTGGTKVMALAVYSLARDLRARFLYLDSDRHPSRIYDYQFSLGDATNLLPEQRSARDLPSLISLEDYLDVHLDKHWPESPRSSQGVRFEQAVAQVLEASPEIDEVKPNIKTRGTLEFDLLIRRANRVGVAELKTGAKATKKVSLAQVNIAARREFLGTYTQKFLIVNQAWNTDAELYQLAKSSDIKIIELPNYDLETSDLPEPDQQRLVREVAEALQTDSIT